MSKFLQRIFVCAALMALPFVAKADDFQVSNSNFEDWSAAQFDGQPQAKGWNASNVEQVGIKFNFAHKETGHNGGYCLMVQDQEVGAMGITATSPGYFALGRPWAYLPGITSINQATAGTSGGITWTHRPDSMAVWIKRTGSDWKKEDFYLLYYSWSGTAKGTSYKNKQKGCTDHTETNEESDIRQALNGNECGTAQKATQVAEGMWRERAQYSNWTKITLPIYYFNNTAPTMMNIIFSASNYPNFRANDGLYAGNSLYVDDVQLIYASTIQKLYVGGREWKAFDPKSSDVQIYELAEDATSIPAIEAFRGAGSLTNARGTTVTFSGRKLEGSEISITNGDLTSTPTVITVKSEDGKSTTTYKIQFQKAAGSNAKLASIAIDGFALSGFNPAKYNYTYDLPYGTTQVPVVTAQKQEDEQKVEIKQATSVNGTATITVTAANGTTKATYSITFKVGQLADNTLKDILVNGKSIPGFTPTQTVYKVSLPVGTTTMPTVKAVSAYADGEQTIVYTAPSTIDGGQYQISVTTPGNTVAKVYKLNFKLEASSYKYLADLQVTGDQIERVNPAQPSDQTKLLFTPENLSYNIYLKIGSTTLPKIMAVKGDEYQAEPVMTSLPAGVVDGTIRITTQAGNGDQAVYKLNFSTSKSNNSYLSNILVDGKPLPNFRGDSTYYEYQLPVGTTAVPDVKGIAGDAYQKVDDPVYGGLNGTTRISVTAGDGSTTTYNIKFSVDTYTDNTLKSLSVGGGYSLQDKNYNPVSFDPQVNEYWVKLNPETTTTLPAVTAVLQNEQYQDTVVRRPTSLNGDYKITVRPRNGASRTYVIHFVFKQSDNTALQMIFLDGQPLEGFDPDKTEYTQVLDTGTTVLPVVTAQLGEASQDTAIVWDGKTVRITVKAQSGTRRTYKIKFVIPSATSAQLEMIYVGGDSLEGFEPNKDEYDYILSTATCPAVTVKASEGQQVTITTPYAAGDAKISVKTEDGSESKYTIHFIAVAPESVRLEDILVGGKSLKDENVFSPTTMHYDRTYTGEHPEIGYKAGETVSAVQILWRGEMALLFVSDKEDNHATYEVAFTRIPSPENQLKAIYEDFGAGAQLIDGFTPATTEYKYTLEAGSDLPEVTYEAEANSQVVFFGQTAKGEWKIVVESESGAKTEYTVIYTIKPYADAKLKNLLLDGTQISGFAEDKFDYSLDLDNGAELPKVTVETKPGQRILIQSIDANTQQIRVNAESGKESIYTIAYNRKISSNAFLKDILINGVSLEGFASDKFNYIDSLDRLDEDLNPVTVVPNVYPIGQLPNQTITTYYSRINGTTQINVTAEDGVTQNNYFIEFPVRKSNNSQLENIELISEEVVLPFKPKTLEYTVELPYGASSCPQLDITKGEEEQRVDIISRPIGETTEVVVYAANGESRTYKILFKMEPMKVKNLLTMIRIKELDQELSLKDKEKRNFDVEMPFGSRSMTVEYAKTYDEQTVFVQPGGVKAPTIITVKSNNSVIPDEVYTINPIVPAADPATLSDIRIKVGDEPEATITGFDPEKFSYIVPVSGKPKLRYTLNKGAEIEILDQTSKHWAAEVTYGEGANARTNTYHVWYYYKDEQIPNAEFNEWSACEKLTSAQKPTHWYTIADVLGKHSGFGTFTPNTLVSKPSEGKVELQTQYSTPGGGMIPGFITLGKVTGNWGVAGSSSFGISGGIPFHNSPDEIIFNYKLETVSTQNQIQYILTGSDGASILEWNETATSSSFKDYKYSLKQANDEAGEPTTLNILINSYKQIDGTIVASGANMIVERIRLTYNHILTDLKVDEFTATKTGNAFEVTLTDQFERIEKPVLSFTGEVRDQAQDVTWKAPTKDADFEIRTADIRNWAENGTDYSDYTLTVKRPLDTKNQLADLLLGGVQIPSFAAGKTAYECVLPSSESKIPDIQPVAASSLQAITTSFDEATSTFTIIVTPEKGEATTYTVHFTTTVSSDATLGNVYVNGHDEVVYDPATTKYVVKDNNSPIITFAKKYDKQLVSLVNGVITVTAEDGITKQTYEFQRVDPDYTPNGTITKFTVGTEDVENFGGANYTKDEMKPEGAVFFTREAARDSVEFIQTETQMEWRVPGVANSYVWSFNTSAASASADLAGIDLNGDEYKEFDADKTVYAVTSDTSIVVDAILAESVQKLSTSISLAGDTIEYAMTVTAGNGTTTKTYRMNISRPKSDDNTLAGIFLDDMLIPDFDPIEQNYTVVLPTPAVKTAQPKMPSITYLAGQAGQTITLVPGELDGEATKIQVVSEDGLSPMNEYSVEIQAEKSHCVDLSGITVNGVAIQGDKDEHFEPGRHYYSLSLKTSDIEVNYTSDDKFQTVTVSSTVLEEESKYRYVLHVVAEDGITTADYQVNIYVENKSTDSQLANILLNGEPMDRYDPVYNTDLVFDPTVSLYEINLAPGTQTLPEVSAVLKMDKQTVDITHPDSATIILTVTAAARGENVTHYTLHFTTPLSTNTNLRVIEENNQPIDGFKAENTLYRFSLPAGTEVPNIGWETEDERAHVDIVHTETPTSQTFTLTVTAEDPSYTKTYTVIYDFVKSSIATLEMILADAQALPDFAPEKLDYSYEHEASKPFPALDYEKGEEKQEVVIDTVSFVEGESLKRSLQVTAENGNTNTYFVEYHIVKSSVDTLLNIIVDGKKLEEYRADVYEYYYRLEAEDAASRVDTIAIDYNKSDETQTVVVKNEPETALSKSLGYKSVITVIAQTGAIRVYTVHYPVALSDVATLKNIYLNGVALEGFDPDGHNYRQEIGMNDALPLVTVEKEEAAQAVDIAINENAVRITVTAEDGVTTTDYNISFERLKSSETKLRDIILIRDNKVVPSSLFPYRPDYYEYTITLDFDGTRTAMEQVPEVEWTKYEEEQTVTADKQELPNGDIQVDITVVAPNGDDQAIYSITFNFRKPSSATLISITLGEKTIQVDPNNTEYEYVHPYGSTTADYFTPDQISYVLTDPLATASHTIDETGKILITVVAQDGSDLTYFVTQSIALDGDNWLKMIELDGVEIRDFDPAVTFYTYYLREGMNPPSIVAIPRSENAEVIYGIAAAGDTCEIICKAADQSERIYRIYFAKSEINDALTPTENDVIIIRVPGENKLLIASIRQNVAFALFDQNGRLVHFEETVPAADPNDVIVFQDVHKKDVFSKLIGDKTCKYIDIIPGQIYFYGFYTSEKKFKSGKIMCQP